jgi:hypothetical protein
MVVAVCVQFLLMGLGLPSANCYVSNGNASPKSLILKKTPFLSVKRFSDTAKIGSLTVPSVGIGTISWSSDSCSKSATSLENEALEDVVSEAYRSNAAFLDTAERKSLLILLGTSAPW